MDIKDHSRGAVRLCVPTFVQRRDVLGSSWIADALIAIPPGLNRIIGSSPSFSFGLRYLSPQLPQLAKGFR